MAIAPGTRVGPYEVTTSSARAAWARFRTFLPGTVGNASSDGQRFLLFTRPGDDGEENQNPLTVVINWQAALN